MDIQKQFDKFILKSELIELFNQTPLRNHTKIVNESIKHLLNNNIDGFLTTLYESEEDDIMDILLDVSYLSFSSDNSKLGKTVATFSLPAGWFCPFALKCMKKVNRDRKLDPEKVGTMVKNSKGNLVPYKGDVVVNRGKETEFDCFSANQEMQYDEVRKNRWHNSDLLKMANGYIEMADLIERSLEYFFGINGICEYVRIHESGDFYSEEYFKAWMEVSKRMPDTKFYAYTKAVNYVKKYKSDIDKLPNFTLTLSYGGKQDDEIDEIDIKNVKVMDSPEEIFEAGLLLDLDDTLSKIKGGKENNFALLVHGTQEKGKKSKIKLRNETFANYWKYRRFLNKIFRDDKDKFMSLEEAEKRLKIVNKLLDNLDEYSKDKGIKLKRNHYNKIKTQLNYVIKYYNYDFDKKLINIIPEKYR